MLMVEDVEGSECSISFQSAVRSDGFGPYFLAVGVVYFHFELALLARPAKTQHGEIVAIDGSALYPEGVFHSRPGIGK